MSTPRLGCIQSCLLWSSIALSQGFPATWAYQQAHVPPVHYNQPARALAVAHQQRGYAGYQFREADPSGRHLALTQRRVANLNAYLAEFVDGGARLVRSWRTADRVVVDFGSGRESFVLIDESC